ncbi:MAG: hypothetical protein ACREEM_32165 [Blastocatellia bacterium]
MKQTQRLQGWWDAHLSPHLAVALATGEELDLVVDSGFNGEIVLPKSAIRKLRLMRDGWMFAELADGSLVPTRTYFGEILWFGQTLEVRIQATDSHEGLLGTELFQGCVVELDPDADRVLFRKKPGRARKRAI